MATVTGTNLLDGVLADLGVTLSATLQAALSARLQAAIDSGNASSIQVAAVLASNPSIAAAVPAGETPLTSISSTVSTVQTEIEAEGVITFTLEGAASVNEGDANTFTVTASEAVTEDTVVTFQLSIDGESASLADFNSGAFNPVQVTIPAGQTTATFDVTAITNDGTETSETYKVTASVAGTDLSATATILDGSVGAGQVFTLTTGLDVLPGLQGSNGNTVTSGNDQIIGIVGGANETANATDQIDAGEGSDNLTLITGAALTLGTGTPSFSNVETLELRGASNFAITADTTAETQLTDVVVKTAGGALDLDAAATQDVTVSGSKAAVVVDGGKDVVVTDSFAGNAITVGAATAAAGTVSVTDTKQGTGAIAVDGGTDTTVTTTVTATAATAAGAVTVGANTAATTSSTVVQNLLSDGVGGDLTAGAVTVTGGDTISITRNLTSTAKDETANNDIVAGTVTATADNDTTSITVDQNATATTFTKAATDVVKETSVVTFKAIASGETIIVNGLTFTASKALTAEQVANAFANLTAADTQSATGPTANGIYTGTFNTAVWTSAAASGATVTFTAQDEDETDLIFTGTGAAPTQVKTTGTAAVAATTSTNAVTMGNVVLNDNATASVTDITVDGFAGASTIGAGNATTKLANLTLANSSAAAASVTVADTADTLALSLENVGRSAADTALTLTAAPTTLNVTSTGNNYVNLTAAATTALNVSGTGVLDADATDLAVLETVVVSGSAGVALNAGVENTVTSVNTSATTGTTTVSIDGTKATYTGGAGVDNVSLATGTALTKAIDLGAGNDTVTFTAAVTGSSAALNGGDGTDTISMTVANAAALDASMQSFYTNFERLTLNNVWDGGTADTAETATIDLANLGFVNYVTTSGTLVDGDAPATESDILVLDKLANNGTVALTAEGFVTVQITDAATNASDVLNVVTNVAAADVTFGTLTANDVETVNISANDTLDDDNSDGTVSSAEAPAETATLTLTADKVATVNLDGSANQTLAVTDTITTLTTVDASAMTGALTYTANDGQTTVTGGAGNDTLIASGSQDVLIGGAGNDSITGADLTTLTGGAGNDTFIFSKPTNVNSYSTITDLSSGDMIDLDVGDAGTVVFSASKVVLAGTAVFQDYANAAVNTLGGDNNDASWFQFGGNTYIIQSGEANVNNDFQNSFDSIVQITGLVDLSTASYNQSIGILEIA